MFFLYKKDRLYGFVRRTVYEIYQVFVRFDKNAKLEGKLVAFCVNLVLNNTVVVGVSTHKAKTDNGDMLWISI